ncbi:peroxidase 29 [Punica granatum]|uniref:Peroxidase n=2 Tax=Punica granatum TaxID=22663 RepID=A0A218XEM0_PUNGR|nr:peroxidase 29 [Punica granatum]OWM83383.1 hypothetical protein CDL15_Pgr012864 [Punica granatum]PKI43691.1 hypothetical protein CRG98_035890 [Punica granatum]
MRICSILLLIGTVILVEVCVGVTEAQLSYGYYRTSCPNLETIVKAEVLSSSLVDSTSPAALLRLMFHDCQVQGCDASILLDPNGPMQDSEMISSRNFGIRKREVIGHIKSVVEVACPGQVSCADIIALAARDSVALSGGPHIAVPLGRKDSRTSSSHMADARLPSPSISVDEFLRTFMSKGMSLEESVAIIGAHTLGAGHCINIVNRLYDAKPDDRYLNLAYDATLRLKCPIQVPLTNLTIVSNDLTPVAFDNQYYRDLAAGKGLFLIDSRLWGDSRTAPAVWRFAADQEYFFQVFSSAFVKLSSTNILLRSKGEIRRHCYRAN